jgi:hypothetical protein
LQQEGETTSCCRAALFHWPPPDHHGATPGVAIHQTTAAFHQNNIVLPPLPACTHPAPRRFPPPASSKPPLLPSLCSLSSPLTPRRARLGSRSGSSQMHRVWGRRLNPRLDGRKRGREWGGLCLLGSSLGGECVVSFYW